MCVCLSLYSVCWSGLTPHWLVQVFVRPFTFVYVICYVYFRPHSGWWSDSIILRVWLQPLTRFQREGYGHGSIPELVWRKTDRSPSKCVISSHPPFILNTPILWFLYVNPLDLPWFLGGVFNRGWDCYDQLTLNESQWWLRTTLGLYALIMSNEDLREAWRWHRKKLQEPGQVVNLC